MSGAPDPEELVMYLIARPDLNMSHGKFGAQCGHATHLCIRSAESLDDPKALSDLREWEARDYPKIVLAGGEKQILKVLGSLTGTKIPHAKVVDLGRTEVAPNTLTMVALGPIRRAEALQYVKRLQAYPRS
jgi:PTH2 family peptidyl-tRNA hydrolase